MPPCVQHSIMVLDGSRPILLYIPFQIKPPFSHLNTEIKLTYSFPKEYLKTNTLTQEYL